MCANESASELSIQSQSENENERNFVAVRRIHVTAMSWLTSVTVFKPYGDVFFPRLAPRRASGYEALIVGRNLRGYGKNVTGCL
jgi:hypothetical protein